MARYKTDSMKTKKKIVNLLTIKQARLSNRFF